MALSPEAAMSASSSALDLGFLPWQIKWCQETVWSEKWKGIKEIDDLLVAVKSALPPSATNQFKEGLTELLNRIGETHRTIRKLNMDHYFSILDTTDRNGLHARHREYLALPAPSMFRQWQKEELDKLRDLLAALVEGDRRLRGYYEFGSRLGEAKETVGADRPLSQKERDYILAGLKRLPLREQREIENEGIFAPKNVKLLALAKQVNKLGRFLALLKS